MPAVDRIQYDGLNEQYIQEQLENGLSASADAMQKKIPVVMPFTGFYTSDEVKAELERNATKTMRFGIRLAFRYKDTIKKIPFLGKWAIGRKEVLLRKRIGEKDCSRLLQLDADDLVYACYQELLERDPDIAGLSSFLTSLDNGMPKEAVIYLIHQSKEFNHRYRIRNIKQYKKAYRGYVFECRYKGRLRKLVWFSKAKE